MNQLLFARIGGVVKSRAECSSKVIALALYSESLLAITSNPQPSHPWTRGQESRLPQ
jgi:hypothetical protein